MRYFIQSILGVVRKEFIQIRRDPMTLRMIFVLPLIQLLILGNVVNTDVKNIALDIYDYDQSGESRRYVDAFRPGGYFTPTTIVGSVIDLRATEKGAWPLWECENRFRRGEADMAIVIPPGFSEKLSRRESVDVGLVVDGADANRARAGFGYAAAITREVNQEFINFQPPITISVQNKFNPEGKSVYFMVPGILATLLTTITVMLTAMGIVREREMGTLEQVMVTPISSSALLMGKVIAFATLGLIEMGVGLAFGILVFGVPFVGSPFLLLGLSLLYLLTTLGIGIFFSTITSTQQQAMFVGWFFSIFVILTSGFFTPIANMPDWLQEVTRLNPMRYFMSIVRAIMMRGAGFQELISEITTLAAYGVVIFGIAAMRFHKRVN